MMYLLGFLGGILFIAGIILLRNITTVFHELGHAIPALAFSDGEVKVFIGSYGNEDQAWSLKWGRLKIVYKWNPFEWQIGLCSFKGVPEIWKQIIIVLGGPLASLIVGIPLLIIVIQNDLSPVWITVSALFCMSALADFFMNIFISGSGWTDRDGALVSDGNQLMSLITQLLLKDNERKVLELIKEDKREEAQALLLSKLEEEPSDYTSFFWYVSMLLEEKKYRELVNKYDAHSTKIKYRIQDFLHLGEAHLKLNEWNAARHYLNIVYKEDQINPKAYFLLGELELAEGNHQQALKFFNGANYGGYGGTSLAIEKSKAFIALQQFEQAKNLLDSVKEEERQGEKDFLMGELYRLKNEKDVALRYYKKAEKREYVHHALAYHIAILEQEKENQ